MSKIKMQHYVPKFYLKNFSTIKKNDHYISCFDKKDENNKFNSVESPRQVSNRVESLINDLEEKYSQKNILLVSHGDCLQIIKTLFENISPGRHRSLNHLNVAEIRKA